MKYKLISFDMDGVIFEHCNFWMELHKAFGTYEEGKELTKKYVKTNYAKLVEEVVEKLWKGKPSSTYLNLIKTIGYMPGAPETLATLHKRGYKTAIISSGPSHLAQRAQKELGIDYIYTNELVIDDEKVTGDFRWPVANDRKAVILRQLAKDNNIDLKDIIVVGDSDNDVKMMRMVGQGIAFRTDSEELKKVAHVVIEEQDLRAILPAIDLFEKRENIFKAIHH